MMGGGIVPKKIVKKKKGKRVGVVTSSTGAAEGVDLPDPTESTNMTNYDERIRAPQSNEHVNGSVHSRQPQSFLSSDYPTTPGVQASESNTMVTSTPIMGLSLPPHIEESPPMRIKAERAMSKADEFIREKQHEMQMRQRSAISSAAERAMHHRANTSGEGGGGGAWKITNDDNAKCTMAVPSLSPSNLVDETFQAAKAAAEEAKKLADSSTSKGKTSLFGGFFNRGKVGGGSGEIASYSSHGGVMSRSTTIPPNHFRRSESGGSSGSGGGFAPPLQTVPSGENPSTLEIPDYQVNVDTILRNEGAEEDERNGFESELERQRRTDLERRRLVECRLAEEERSAAAARHSVEADRQRRAEEEKEEARAETQRLEAEKRRAPREKVRSALDRLASRARSATDDVARIREARATLVERKVAAEKAERYAAQRAKFAEAQQAVAVEEEDFESADHLGGVIEQHTREKEEHAEMRRAIESAIVELDMEGVAASRAVAACFVEVRTNLAEVQSEVDNRSKEEEVQSQLASTSKRLSSESERLVNESKNIERDEQVLAEEQKELDNQIGEETKEFDEKRKEANSKVEVVNKTIMELRKQLAEAEAHCFDLNMEIKSYNQSIEHVRSKYSRQLTRLKKKSQSVKESRADWMSEKGSIDKAKIAHDAVVTVHSEEMVDREKIINEIKLECMAAKELEEIVSSAFEMANARGISSRAVGDEGSEDTEVLKYEAVLNEANQKFMAAEANISSLQEELSEIEVRVPILEAEKKNAASKRDFKLAGQASKNIKDALARMECIQTELVGEAMERKQSTKEDLEKVTTILEEKKKIVEMRDKDAGLTQMNCLKEKITELMLVYEKFLRVCGDDSEDDYMHVSLVGSFVISAQIAVLDAERNALGEKYGVVDNKIDEIVENVSMQSGPSFESTSDFPDIIINANVLERYDSLSNEINDLENAIEEAVNEEEFDKAVELEERMSTLQEEFEKSGFTSESFGRALQEFEGKTSSDGKEAQEVVDVSSNKIPDEVLEIYTSLCLDIRTFEAKLENAVDDESFDLANELNEKMEAIRLEIEGLGFSTEDLEGALKDRSINGERNNEKYEGNEELEDVKTNCH